MKLRRRIALVTLAAGGIWQLRVQDDLRLWISIPPALLDQAKRIGDITSGHLSTGSQIQLLSGIELL